MELCPRQPPRPFVSEGLIAEIATRTRTSLGPGSGTGIWPTCSTSRAGPLRSYQAARIIRWPGGEGVDIGCSSTGVIASDRPLDLSRSMLPLAGVVVYLVRYARLTQFIGMPGAAAASPR